ncbi:glycosyltransferase family 2 protein [Cellulomonas composti]|nr:glycosyltransferase family 2 protein [Cellulomonas composti]
MCPDPAERALPADPPAVSVILAVRDEERDLTASVERILAQDYPGELEVVLAVGPSADRTLEIARDLATRDPRVQVLESPTGITPASLNLAVGAARHDVLVRVDGHSELSDGYVTRAVAELVATGAANVGGRMVPVGRTPFQRAVARAMSTPLGIGAAPFHTGGARGPAPTVYLGVFRRDALERVGGFDEHFVRAQDWELNHRLRSAGEVVWFDPDLAVTYRPRGDARALARQFFRTGQWRRQVVRTYPETAGLRYLAPPAVVLAVGGGVLLVVVGATFGPSWPLLGGLAPLTYALGVVVGSAVVSRGLGAAAAVRLPAVVATMHLAWGAGFLRGVTRTTSGAARAVDYPDAANAPDRVSTTAAPDRPVTED